MNAWPHFRISANEPSPNSSDAGKKTPMRWPISPWPASRCATKTASKVFRAKKKLDPLARTVLPGIYLPLYTMVTFTRMPYAGRAARIGSRNDRLRCARPVADFGAVACRATSLTELLPRETADG